MFEQSTLDTRGALRSPWALTVSVFGQALVVSTAFLVSILRTDALPRSLLSIGLVYPGVPAGPAAKPSPSSTARPRASRTAFTQPSMIPTRIASFHDTALAPPADEIGDGPSIPGGIGAGPGLHSVLLDAIARPAPPPPVAQSKPAAAAAPIPVTSVVQAAKLIRQVKPPYPPLAVSAHISGTVRLVAIIGRDGAIRNLQVTSGHPLLTPAAVEAVKQWLYHPTLLNGEPVEVITQVDVNFTLSR